MKQWRKKLRARLERFPSLLRVAEFTYRLFVILPSNAIPLVRTVFSANENEVLTKKNTTYFGDGFATIHHVEFLEDPRFLNAYSSAWDHVPPHLHGKRNPTNIEWRAHIVTWSANQLKDVAGDWVECGVWYGLLPRIMYNYSGSLLQDRKCWLFDSWGDPELGENNHPDYRDDVFTTVSKRFADLPNVNLVRGLVPEVLSTVEGRKIAFLGIDMNGSVAERAALDLLYDQIVPGGIIYFDDYGWNFPDLRETVNEFFSSRPEELLHFPGGNAIVIKI